MKDLTPCLRRIDSSWTLKVHATEAAIEQIRTASRELQRPAQSLWRETAAALVAHERQFADSAWYARQKVIDLAAINVGASSAHPELIHPIRFGFLVQRDAHLWLVGTSNDFTLPAAYPVQALIEEVRLAAISESTGRGRYQQSR